MKVFKVKVFLKPIVKVTGLSALQCIEANKIVDNLKGDFCIHHSIQTCDEYIGYKKIINLVRCKDEQGKTIDNSGR